jgi:hypothetical protein
MYRASMPASHLLCSVLIQRVSTQTDEHARICTCACTWILTSTADFSFSASDSDGKNLEKPRPLHDPVSNLDLKMIR